MWIKAYVVFIISIGFLYSISLASGMLLDNKNDTVSDKATGLMWQQKDDSISRTWDAARVYCEVLALASYEDWRLPDIKELESIINKPQYVPAVETPIFPHTQHDYWSTTMAAFDGIEAWAEYIDYGSLYRFGKNGVSYVRCVRDSL